MGPLVAHLPSPDVITDDDPADDLRALIKLELVPGERLLWAGRPGRGAVEGGSWVPGAVWWAGGCLMAATGGALLVSSGGNGRVEWIGAGLAGTGGIAAFLCTTIVIETARDRWTERRKRSRMSYALTDRRAIGWVPAGGRGVKVMTIPRRSIGSIHRIERQNGSGSVRFAGNVPQAEFAGFEGISDVRRVEKLARETLVDPDFRDLPDAADFEEG